LKSINQSVKGIYNYLAPNKFIEKNITNIQSWSDLITENLNTSSRSLCLQPSLKHPGTTPIGASFSPADHHHQCLKSWIGASSSPLGVSSSPIGAKGVEEDQSCHKAEVDGEGWHEKSIARSRRSEQSIDERRRGPDLIVAAVCCGRGTEGDLTRAFFVMGTGRREHSSSSAGTNVSSSRVSKMHQFTIVHEKS
jgi:hypothetical protein